MENPMNKWMIWGESPLFSETSKKGIRFGNIWFQGFTFILVDPKPTDRCLGAPSKPWKGLLQAVDDQIVFHPGQEL